MQTAISVEQLTKSYGRKMALDNLNLTVEAGTVFGLLGANGAGKSTAIECIMGTKVHDRGRALILGKSESSSRRVIIRVRSRYMSCVRRSPVSTEPQRTGRVCAKGSVSEISSAAA